MHDMTHAVVVGYDGSASAGAAVDWAVAEAARRGSTLALVHSTDITGVLVGPENVSSWLVVPYQDAVARRVLAVPHEDAVARRVVEEGMARARKTTTEVVSVTEVGGAARVLTRASETADLLVVGSRGHGSFTGALLGSVAFAVTARASCPVVVARGDTSRAPGPGWPVVAAVDGSLEADAATDHAASVAAATDAALHLVSVWQMRAAESWATTYVADVDPDRSLLEAPRADAEALLEQSRQRVARTYPGLRVHTRAVEGITSRALAEASRGAGLLVMGSRGRSGLAGLLLGSTSRALVHLAECPVAVVKVRRGVA